MGALQTRRPAPGRSARAAWAVAAVLIASCGAQATSPEPTAMSAPTASPSGPAASPSSLPAPTPTPAAPSPLPAPTASPAPTPDATTLAAVYAALRPSNLRTEGGTTVFTRPAGAIGFDYEMVNRSSVDVVVPITAANDRPAAWFGTIQTWVEPLGSADALASCLDWAGRKGTWYATGGAEEAFAYLSSSDRLPPGTGVTHRRSLPGEWTACFPAGRYRFHLEYKPLDAVGLDDVIASATVDFELRDPALRATIAADGITGRATLVLGPGGASGSSVVELRGLHRGARVTTRIRADGCTSADPLVAAPAPFTATLGGTQRQRWVFNVNLAAARQAIAAAATLWIRVTVGTSSACARYAPEAPAPGDTRPPTAGPGPFLTDTAANGWVVRASSETFLGRPAQAVDGLVDRTWNAGGWPPAWIEIDFGRNSRVTGIRLLPSQLPNEANTLHRVYGRAAGSTTEVLLAELDAVTRDNEWITVGLEAPASIRYLRVVTVSSPSWVAWREIEVTGPVAAPVSLLPVGTHDGSLSSLAAGDRCYANGWASDPDDGSQTVTVRVLVDGRAVWKGPADEYRQDLQDAGIGDGTAGFWVNLRGLLTLGVKHEIRTQALDGTSGRWVDLNLTPRTITCT